MHVSSFQFNLRQMGRSLARFSHVCRAVANWSRRFIPGSGLCRHRAHTKAQWFGCNYLPRRFALIGFFKPFLQDVWVSACLCCQPLCIMSNTCRKTQRLLVNTSDVLTVVQLIWSYWLSYCSKLNTTSSLSCFGSCTHWLQFDIDWWTNLTAHICRSSLPDFYPSVWTTTWRLLKWQRRLRRTRFWIQDSVYVRQHARVFHDMLADLLNLCAMFLLDFEA